MTDDKLDRVERKPDFARPTSRPISGRDTMQDRAAPKRSDGGSRRAAGNFSRRLHRAGFEPRRTLRFVICHLSFVILFAACATRPTFRTVVVDPGHGGHDPGATQRGVLPEKTWTLDLAYRLKNRLEAGGFNVVLTRQTDFFIPLEDRVLISNSQPNVIFVSLHFNSIGKRDIQGVETYYDTNRSAKLAAKVQQSILQLADVFDRRVKTAPYYVIRYNSNPAILIEGGFLSNPVESRRIAAPSYRDALAEQIYQGIIAYRGRPPIQETGTAQR